MSDDRADGDDADQVSRLRRMARRLLDRKDLAEDTATLLSGLLDTGDRYTTEAVKLVAREVRTYLEELRLKEAVLDLAKGHSLEVSIRLKPLVEAVDPPKQPE
jgi:hypothetical protein